MNYLGGWQKKQQPLSYTLSYSIVNLIKGQKEVYWKRSPKSRNDKKKRTNENEERFK